MTYDSRPDTLAHIRRVQELLAEVQARLNRRAIVHDKSKLESPEVEVFDRETPSLRSLTYGSDGYKAALQRLGVGLEHHYANNRHHPEYWAYDEISGCVWQDQVSSGQAISQMTLLDIMEMLVDWKAATERHDNGDIKKSIDQNAERFGYSDPLRNILHNTARELGWYEPVYSEDEKFKRLQAEFLYEVDRKIDRDRASGGKD